MVSNRGQLLGRRSVLGFPFKEADISAQNEVEASISAVSKKESKAHFDNLTGNG